MLKRFLLHAMVFAFLVGAFSIQSFSQKRKPKPKPKAKSITAVVTVKAGEQTAAERRQETFFRAWSIISVGYYDKSFGGLDWNKVRVEFEPRVKKAKTDAELHQLLAEMIGRLGRSHLAIIVPEYFDKIATAKQRAREREKELSAERLDQSEADDTGDDDELFGDPGNKVFGIGIELRMLGGQMVVTQIEDQSGAKLAGLKTGYIVDKVNGVSLKDLVAQARINGLSGEKLEHLLPILIVSEFLNGEADSSVFLTCLDENDRPKEFTVPRLELNGETISLGRNFPEQFLEYKSFSLSPEVGYISFNAFAVPVIGKFCDSLSEFKDKKALVVDLRGNLGGIIVTMIGLSGMLTDKQITLGTFVSGTSKQRFSVPSKAKNFKGRVILLVDGQSMSASEMFAAGLQSNKRAVVVGEQTGGQSLPSIWTRLPTGAVMVYPISDFQTLAGKSLEGVGLQPDYTVALNRRSLLEGVDQQLQKALAVIDDEKAFSAKARSDADSDDPPPPPPPRAVGSGSSSSAVAPPPAVFTKIAPKPTPGSSDERSLKIVADFSKAIGDDAALKKYGSYEAKGRLVPDDTVEMEGEIYAARQMPDKTAIILNTVTAGEVRTVYRGKTSFQQADYGMNNDFGTTADAERADLFSPYFLGLDLEYLRGLKFEGEYEVEGSMRYVLSATSPEGFPVGLSFEAESKLLKTFSLPGMLYTFGDYRLIGGLKIPFQIDLDRAMNIRLDSVVLDPKFDPSVFEKKENCFDKPD
ncbi:MAG: S41 family peptidase [Pyrinomonadaceae bacterium]